MGDVVIGNDRKLQMFREGALVAAFDVTGFTARQEVDTRKRALLGRRDHPSYQVFNGWSGTAEIERTEDTLTLDDLIDALEGQYYRGERVDELQFAETTRYSDGTRRTYIYPEVRINVDENARGSDAVTVTVTWTTGAKRVKA